MDSRKVANLIERIKARRLTYLSHQRLQSIADTCLQMEACSLDGVYIEAGCALGGSAILIASLKSPHRPFHIYDVFDMIPPPTENDTPDVHERYQIISSGNSAGIQGDRYYGYEVDLFERVIASFKDFGLVPDRESIHFHRGPVEQTMTLNDQIALAHIDVDWYSPVRHCLAQIFAALANDGILIVDDYHDWGGCRKAVDEFLRENSDFICCDDSASSLKLTRISRQKSTL